MISLHDLSVRIFFYFVRCFLFYIDIAVLYCSDTVAFLVFSCFFVQSSVQLFLVFWDFL